MSSKKVAIIGTVGLPACYGGFETLTAYLVKHLSQEHDFTVYCTGKRYPKAQRQSHCGGARLVFLPFDANGIQSILYDCLSILHALLYADVLLVLGVSGGIMLPFVKLFTKKKIIVSIDGIEWRRAKWNFLARWYLRLAESLAVRFSHADISDNDAIQDYTAQTYSTRSRVVEYGGDHATRQPITQEHKIRYPFLCHPYAFKVCRIEPENNVPMILAAFAELPEYPLVLVGNWNNSEFGRTMKARYGSCPNLHLLDPIYDQNELNVLRGNCFVYVHGHSAGGTNPSLVEAMSLGLPVLAFGVSFNKATAEHKALFFSTQDDIKTTIKNTTFAQWQQQGAAMQAIARRRYTWDVVARKYNYLIHSVCTATEKGGLHPRLSQFSQEVLLQNQLGHYQALNMFYENEG
ncbi:DUF1972 domain-containing protein [Hymenobacter yonginensis]|uniref:DUF1972 domain-containing protein n=1 Tax=Hymenobacter yonginensis TaxID=748197 RepID=A0ABY7PRC0_9BACT|nr:DUF1972 domain-containing protein [Hymenobacter yonginensis]WBO85405.1 DUF1972 domain-containing protein [Hymenobacter yonginensis]